MRVLVALGGNAMTSPDGRARPEDQIAAVTVAVEPVADLVADGIDVVLTHGNGPQVGNLLVKNELAASVVPPVTLDWCGAQTQGTIGMILMNALERALAARGVDSRAAALVTRIGLGQNWEDRGERGWRRVVPSPQPRQILDAPAVSALITAGYVVVAAGGGGVPVVRDPDGLLRGVEAVIDKDLAAALLGRTVGADVLVIATDVDHAVLGFGTADEKPIGRVDVATMRRHADEGWFGSGSMGPKVEAACRFVEQGGRRAVITSLDQIAAAARGGVGTEVVPDSSE